MKKLLLGMLIFCNVCLLFANNGYRTSFRKMQSNGYEITFNLDEYRISDVFLSGQEFSKIEFAGSVRTNDKGWAELPFISATLQLPDDKNVDLQVTASDFIDVVLPHPLVPARGSISRSQNPADVPYVVAAESKINEFYPQQLAKMESPFIIRDVRGTTVRVFPFRYNAVTNTLRIYSRVVVTLTENDVPATNPMLRADRANFRGNEALYKSMFLNYTPATRASATLSMSEYGDILILTPSSYESTIAPYVQWKREKGYNVTTKVVPNAANVVDTIKKAYNANPNLMFVQLIGDWANIKSASASCGYYGSGPTDPYMGCVSGNDNYPDIAIGRFSCSGTNDLLVQLNKSIDYEKTPDMTTGWRETFIGIGSEEGTGDDDEYDYAHVQRIYSERLQGMGYQTHKQNYGSSASSATLATHVNAGASTIAYCGHGDVDMWVTTYYNNTQVNSSTNGVKLPFIVSVACLNGAFHESSDCFAEKWLRKSNGGAVVTWMSTISQPWTPPQRGQDYFYDILSGGFNYDNYSGQDGYNTTELRTHWGSITVNSSCLMLKESSQSDDIYTVKTWTTFGDASLQLRTKTPEALVLSNTSVMAGVPFSGTATVNGTPMENVLICISQNGQYFRGLTDANGQYSINHTFTSDSVLLVATAFNTTTIYEKSLCTTPCNGVANLTADTVNTYDVTLAWTAPAEGNVTGYNVYCDGHFVATTTATSYLHSQAANGTYHYCVNVLYDGEECPVQTCASATINDGINHDCNGVTGLTGAQEYNTVVLNWTAPAAGTHIFEDVESHTAFTINSPGSIGWSYIDNDGERTYGFNNYSFTNSGEEMAYIVLNTEQMVNSQTQAALSSLVPAHSGEQFFASIAAITPPNDDWLISPELNCNGNIDFSFYARGSHNSNYVESFEVAYSTSGDNASDFTNVVATVSSVPFSWTYYTYSIPANAKHIAIHCTSDDAYYLCVDDITIDENATANIQEYVVYCDDNVVGTTTNTSMVISSFTSGEHEYCVEARYDDGCLALPVCTTLTLTGGTEPAPGQDDTTGIATADAWQFTLYPNPASDVLHLQTNGKGEIEILNFLGQIVYKENISSQKQIINTKNLTSGVYFIRWKNEKHEVTKKFIKK